jgi:hypothetical protein
MDQSLYHTLKYVSLIEFWDHLEIVLLLFITFLDLQAWSLELDVSITYNKIDYLFWEIPALELKGITGHNIFFELCPFAS